MLNRNEMAALSIHDGLDQGDDKDDEPTVINYTCLINLITQQAPRGEAGRLYHEDGIKLNEIKEIRVEFLRILKIDHLWIMTNLVKLSLSHNKIEKIENLDALVKLCELDISFNSIKIMENLNCLSKLEILLLAGNQVETVEGIGNLTNLTIFSIANNKIQGWEHVLYLRQFKNLRSVNFTGNPCTLQENYNDYLIAFLPQIIYFSYSMIREEDRIKAMKIHRRSIAKIELDEAKSQSTLEEEHALNKKSAIDSAAFVDHLDGDEMFLLLFLNDKEGTALKNISDDTLAVFNEYKTNFSTVCHEFYQFGIEQHSLREKEIEMFSAIVEEARDAVRDKARRIIDSIEKYKNENFAKFNVGIKEFDKKLDAESAVDQTDLPIDVKIAKIQNITENFNEFLSSIWTKLVYSEAVLHEQIEDVNETFKLNIADMKDIFVESTRKSFSRMRNILVEYHDTIQRVIASHLNDFTQDELTMPSQLIDICGDINILSNTLASSHDIHLQIIDSREDETISSVNKWFNDLVTRLRKHENSRHRHRILEISHVLQYYRELLQKHILTTNDEALDVVAALEG
ncbi:hypothetical protein PV327_001604 [Microctonus hyperodae]|uniref:Dynein axonemal assembly factor 1 homolog n=1 Tax=Microctonus hyperodae TaxID=165561 RepID=A0AA39FDU9_MICHY|nr:hypothetical protein PV327_001604 [Microctonus hyperodae]